MLSGGGQYKYINNVTEYFNSLSPRKGNNTILYLFILVVIIIGILLILDYTRKINVGLIPENKKVKSKN